MTSTRVSTADGAAVLRTALVGSRCTSIENAEYSWHFGFGVGQSSLALECPWRLRFSDSIAYGSQDHGQKFGLPEPVDGVAKSKYLIGTSPVSFVEIEQGCGDLSIEFENRVRLEIFNGSSGYEGWKFNSKGGLFVVAQGGGNLACSDPVAVSETVERNESDSCF